MHGQQYPTGHTSGASSPVLSLVLLSHSIYLLLSRNYVTAFDAYIQPFPNWYSGLARN